MLEVAQVRKVFPGRRRQDPEVVALNSVSFRIENGELFCMLGPSGCGKSTLLRIMAGLASATQGTVYLDGKPVVKTSRNTLVVWQEFALLDWRTVRGNIEFGLEVNGYKTQERKQISDRLMRTVGLSQFANHYPSELSGGMRQRVGLARALALDPEILLMDEPFGALDAQTRMVMQEEVLRIWEQFKKTIVLVTHSIEEAIMMADRVAVFTARPGEIKEIVPITLARPRAAELRSSPEFGRIYEHLYRLLKEEVMKATELEALAG
jgi:ABC-type nitrate/sulfonate/bicarbonate transport system ATPase subunit